MRLTSILFCEKLTTSIPGQGLRLCLSTRHPRSELLTSQKVIWYEGGKLSRPFKTMKLSGLMWWVVWSHESHISKSSRVSAKRGQRNHKGIERTVLLAFSGGIVVKIKN